MGFIELWNEISFLFMNKQNILIEISYLGKYLIFEIDTANKIN